MTLSHNEEFDFTGQTVFITGTSRGIGYCLAKCYLSKGAVVYGTSRINDVQLGPKYYHNRFDLTKMTDIEACAQLVESINADVLVNNSGINKINPFLDISLTEFQDIQSVNVLAPFRFCQAAVKGMSTKGVGRIINISSIWGHLSRKYRASYSASKFALNGLSIALAAEVSQYGIMVNTVSPGFVDTELTRQNLTHTQIKTLSTDVPVGRLATTKEVADTVIWLTSKSNTFITGQNITVDGGFTNVR